MQFPWLPLSTNIFTVPFSIRFGCSEGDGGSRGGGGEDDDAANLVGEGSAREPCRGFPLVKYKINLYVVLT